MYSTAKRVFNFSEVVPECTFQLPETNTFYMQCILGVIIIVWLKKMTKLFYFLNGQMRCFIFPQKFCVSSYQMKAYNYFYLSLNSRKFYFFGKQTEFTIKIKTFEMLWSFFKK